MKIIIVRHGETEWNKAGLQQGHLNSPLTSTGVKQAELIGKALVPYNIEIIYSSDLGRAYDTAVIISKYIDRQIIKNEGLRERNLGILQGLTMAGFEEKYPEDFKVYGSGSPDYSFQTGESKKYVHERHLKSLDEIAGSGLYETILIVAHGGVIDNLFRHVFDISLDKKRNFSLFNTAINIFNYMNGAWNLELWGDIGHLGKVGALDDF